MPPVFFALAAAAGFIAAARLLSAIMDPPSTEAKAAHDGQTQAAPELARDLGQLEWDAANGVYRPRS